MCFFPRSNNNTRSRAYALGVEEFDCGYCPECLSKKARLWSLRCQAESVNNVGCMITLTYDTYKHDKYGRIIGENDPDKQLHVDKRDCQLFIKRLRKHFKNVRIKYLLTAEYGKRTHRAHYHAILFGVQFPDLVFYKRSKRGNIIYKSQTLTDIWGKGICTVDSINVNGAVARYCTKYCAKDTRAEDTFMLFSRGIGDEYLMDKFNGISYFFDGIEYAIPKLIWNKYIASAYKNNYIFNKCNASTRYRSYDWFLEKFEDPHLAKYLLDYRLRANRIFANFKRANAKYKRYLQYWKNKAELINLNKPSIEDRITALDDSKYFAYKNAAIKARLQYHECGDCIVPRSKKLTWWKWKRAFAPKPLVYKGQMTPPPRKKYTKTAFWVERIHDFIYLRPQRGRTPVSPF